MKKVLIAINSLNCGGIQKSFLAFAEHIKEYAEIDLLVWYKNVEDPIEVPSYVNVLNVPVATAVSVAAKENGIFSRAILYSAIGRITGKPWKAMPKLKKKYDVAIAYSHVSSLKYFIIDKVDAKKKYAFFHNGAYTFDEHTKQLDKKYYLQYDGVCAVSPVVERLLRDVFGDKLTIRIVPNAINEREILRLADEPCFELERFRGYKIVTVSRLSLEKDPLFLVDVCEELSKYTQKFRMYIIGNGNLKEKLVQYIREKRMEDYVALLGYSPNPYSFMKSSNLYIQMSEYESESITVKEAALIGKPMILSDIEVFREFKSKNGNITIADKDAKKVACSILHIMESGNLGSAVKSLNTASYQAIDALFE